MGLLCSLLFSCYQPKEGCLDSRAVNYDVSADDLCCCTYPNLYFTIGYFYDGEGFRSDRVYYMGSDSFKISSLDILISDVALVKSGDSSGVDSVRNMLLSDGEEMLFRDDFAHLKTGVSRTTIGRFLATDTFDRLDFSFGLNKGLDINPKSLSSIHPLSPELSGWTDSTGFAFMRMTLIRGASFSDTLSLWVGEEAGDLPLQLPINIITKKGTETEISLQMSISDWMQRIDVGMDTEEQMQSTLYGSLDEVISIF